MIQEGVRTYEKFSLSNLDGSSNCNITFKGELPGLHKDRGRGMWSLIKKAIIPNLNYAVVINNESRVIGHSEMLANIHGAIVTNVEKPFD
jgi:hypothetical protein